MAALDWGPSYQLGIPLIDEQHRRLFALFNTLLLAMKSGKGKAVLVETLASLAAYTREHFADEERLLKQSAYPELAEHQRAHGVLLRKVDELVEGSRKGEFMTIEVLNFVARWLAHHIGEIDRAYVPYVVPPR
jgi:hemerythrin-like metal-binding protein